MEPLDDDIADGRYENPPHEDLDLYPEGYPDHRDAMPDGVPPGNIEEIRLGDGPLETPVEQPGRQAPLITTLFPAINIYQYYLRERGGRKQNEPIYPPVDKFLPAYPDAKKHEEKHQMVLGKPGIDGSFLKGKFLR